jgi:hypothetical protein
MLLRDSHCIAARALEHENQLSSAIEELQTFPSEESSGPTWEPARKESASLGDGPLTRRAKSTFIGDLYKTGGFEKKPPASLRFRSLERDLPVNLDQSAFYARALVGAVRSGGLNRELV